LGLWLVMLLGFLRDSEWIGRRAACRAAIAAEADRLIAKFHDQAYYEAKDRVRGRCIDGTQSTRYWTGVKLEIAKRQGIDVGLSGADMWA